MASLPPVGTQQVIEAVAVVVQDILDGGGVVSTATGTERIIRAALDIIQFGDDSLALSAPIGTERIIREVVAIVIGVPATALLSPIDNRVLLSPIDGRILLRAA